MLRIVPLVLFLSHTLSLLQALHCQTSPNFSFLKYGTAGKHVDLDFAGEGGLLYYISSTLLFWESDGDSCLAVDLIPSRSEVWDRKGSLSLLWPLFQSLCLGQFIETLSSTVQGRPLMTETGMSIFEHSLAFAESEAMISSRLGLSLLGSSANRAPTSSDEEGTVKKLFTKSEILQKMNTPPEVLLMGVSAPSLLFTSTSRAICGCTPFWVPRCNTLAFHPSGLRGHTLLLRQIELSRNPLILSFI